MVIAIVTLALIFADQLSKALAFALYGGGEEVERVTYWLGEMFGINNVYNEGISFSIGENGEYTQPVVIALTLVASAAIIFFLCKLSKDRRLLRWSLALILAGAVGNLIDRIAIGAVRDFIFMDFGFTSFSNNVADLEITVGAVLFVVALLFVDKDAVFRSSKKEEEQAVEEAAENLEGKGVHMPDVPSCAPGEDAAGAPQEGGAGTQSDASQERAERPPQGKDDD